MSQLYVGQKIRALTGYNDGEFFLNKGGIYTVREVSFDGPILESDAPGDNRSWLAGYFEPVDSHKTDPVLDLGPLFDALKACHTELRYMLNAYPKRRGGKYEEALNQASKALNVPTGLREENGVENGSNQDAA